MRKRKGVELQFRVPPVNAIASDDKKGPLLQTAVIEQLGVEVGDGRTSAEVLVIDHIERPSEN